MIIVIPADERARALPLLFEENTAFAAGELPVVLQGYSLAYFGAFRGAGEAFLLRNGTPELTGERPGARHEARDVAERGARIADEGERRFVIFPRLTGEACDDVRAEGDSRNALLECAREHAVASALHGQVNEFVQAVVLICFEERVEISENMPRVAHSDAYPVIARDARKNFLQQFREVRAGVESVAARVLPGEADFPAAVAYEERDFAHERLFRGACELAFHEMRGAVGAGVETAFLDVHRADVTVFAAADFRRFFARFRRPCRGVSRNFDPFAAQKSFHERGLRAERV